MSVLTVTTGMPDRADWLLTAHESIHSTALAAEHVVVINGNPDPAVPAKVALCDATIVIPLTRAVPLSVARTFGLFHATGHYVTTLDDDGLLPYHALDVRVAALRDGHPWVAGAFAYQQHDGRELTWPAPAGPGPYRAGRLFHDWWADPHAPVPLAPHTLMTNSDLLRAAGGWPALPDGDDLALLATITGLADGLVLPDTVYLQRLLAHDLDQYAQRSGPCWNLDPDLRDVVHRHAHAMRAVALTALRPDTCEPAD